MAANEGRYERRAAGARRHEGETPQASLENAAPISQLFKRKAGRGRRRASPRRRARQGSSRRRAAVAPSTYGRRILTNVPGPRLCPENKEGPPFHPSRARHHGRRPSLGDPQELSPAFVTATPFSLSRPRLEGALRQGQRRAHGRLGQEPALSPLRRVL